MPRYLTLVKFTPEGLERFKVVGKAFLEVTKMVGQTEIKLIGGYAMMGPYHMMLIFEAPDEEVAAGVAASFTKKWGAQTETWTQISATAEQGTPLEKLKLKIKLNEL